MERAQHDYEAHQAPAVGRTDESRAEADRRAEERARDPQDGRNGLMARTLVGLPHWVRCINCKALPRDGVIPHLHTCPDYVRPARGATRSCSPSGRRGRRGA